MNCSFTILILHPHIESTNDQEMERNPAYVPIEMNQIEDKPTYKNFENALMNYLPTYIIYVCTCMPCIILKSVTNGASI